MADSFTGDQFVAVFPEFAGLDNLNTIVSSVLNAMIISEINQASFGTEYNKALMLLLAHWFTLSNRRGGGALTSERVGELSRSFQNMPITNVLSTTSYGQMFLKLARRKVGSQIFIGQKYDAGVLWPRDSAQGTY